MDPAVFRALLADDGQKLLGEAMAADLSEGTLIATASRLRDRYPAELVAAALTQARLRERGRAKFGELAARMYFTPGGLEQATRASVAAHRARRFAAGTTVGDLCCGVGGDLIFLAQAGCRVRAVDRDPLTVAVARANLDALGLGELASAHEGDAMDVEPGRYEALFADPARRTTRGRVFEPEAYAPPLSAVLGLARRAPGACVKTAPGIPHDAVPEGAEAEWVSDDGEVKEAALWFGALSSGVTRRATILARSVPGGTATLVPGPSSGPPPAGPWRRYLYEPDGAVIRAHLVGEVAALVHGTLADPRIAYVTSDRLTATPFARAYEIDEVMPFSVKRVRAVLRARGIGVLTIKKRGSAVDIERLRRDLRLSGPDTAVLVLTRVGLAPIALLCRDTR